jgi:hypothetical protein
MGQVYIVFAELNQGALPDPFPQTGQLPLCHYTLSPSKMHGAIILLPHGRYSCFPLYDVDDCLSHVDVIDYHSKISLL